MPPAPFGFSGLPFGGLGASFFDIPGTHSGISGAPWEAILIPREHLGRLFWHLGTTLEDHGSSRKDSVYQIFVDFGMILGVFMSVLVVFGFGLFPGHLFIDF